MLWAQYIPPALEESSSARPVESLPWDREERQTVALLLLIGLLVVGALAGVFVWKNYRLSGLDDYRAGYAVGTVWRHDGMRDRDCTIAVEPLYGGGWPNGEPGWGEFLAGCRDGQTGESPAAWYQLRERMWGDGD